MNQTVSPSRDRLRRISDRVSTWFIANARDLPWREWRNGYTALVSEAMLQQTQVSRVQEYYARFMRRFPTVRDLANANEQEVLTAWQGLGYYRRARNLHAAAQSVMRDFDGGVPSTVEELQQLPGVGRYTAGAIASIVFGQRVPIVDGNVQRVLARVFAREGPSNLSSNVAWAWQRASEVVAVSLQPATLNEGLMELGATVCMPANPACHSCPLARLCVAKRTGQQNELPQPKSRTARRVAHHYAVIHRRRDGRVLLERRPSSGLWSNMWQVPTFESTVALSIRHVRSGLAIKTGRLKCVDQFTHHTTHRIIHFRVFRAVSAESHLIPRVGATKRVWRRVDDLDDLPLSNPQRRIIGLMNSPASDRERTSIASGSNEDRN